MAAMADLLCTKCRKATAGPADAWAQLRPGADAPPGERLAAAAQRYGGAAAARHASLVAADRFYQELVACQWRLDAADAQLSAVEAPGPEARGAAAAPRAEQDLAPAVPPQEEQAEALGAVMAELRRQRAAAREALEERASSYSLGVPSGHGRHSKRFARGPAEREEALERYRQVADAAFDQILAEAEELSRLPLGPDWRARLGPGLRRRRRFWEGQLEEAWSAWQEATTAMHRAGDEAVDAWRSVGELAELAGPAGGLREAAPVAPPAALQEGMVLLAARGLEAELVGAMGLSGLSDGGCHFDCRAELLLEVLEALRAAGALADVGDALLGGGVAAEWLAAQAAPGGPPHRALSACELPTPTAQEASRALRGAGCAERGAAERLRAPSAGAAIAAAEARLAAAAAAAGAGDGVPPERQPSGAVAAEGGGGRLLPWLTECLVQATSRAAERGDVGAVTDLVELAELLGGAGFGEAVQGEAARRCSGDAAAAADHGAVACVLQGSRLRSCATAAEVCGVLAESALEDGLEPEDDEHGPP